MSKSIPIRLPEGLLEAIDLYTKDQHSDRATTMRHWIYQGAEEYLIRLLSQGKISRGRVVELLGITYYDIYDLARKYGVELGATVEQFRESLKNIPSLKESERGPRAQES